MGETRNPLDQCPPGSGRDRTSHLGVTVEKVPVVLIHSQRDQFYVTLYENCVKNDRREVGRVEVIQERIPGAISY